ncbi:MAG: hypothetical protein ABIO60_06285 [Aquaticitalea sp.]
MKTNFIFPILFLVLSCNSSTDKKKENKPSSQPAEETRHSDKTTYDTSLKQNGDYTALFIRDDKDCDLLSLNEMATVLKLDESHITTSNGVYGFCKFSLNLVDGTKTALLLSALPYKKIDISREIESFMKMENDFGSKNTIGGYLVLSDSKDTYFGIRSDRGELFMFNPTYDGAIMIKFGSVVEAATMRVTYTEEQKKQRLDNAVAVANFLLKKYKN